MNRIVRLQTTRPARVLAIVGLVTAVALALATRLTILTGFESLLPESRASVEELHRVAAHTGGVSTLFVVLEGQSKQGLRAAGDALVPALVAIGPPLIGQGEDGIQDVVKFLEPRAGLFTSTSDLAKLRDDVVARFDYEVGRQTGASLDLSPEDIPPPIDGETVKARLHANAADEKRFPDGYYQSQDGKTLVIALRSGIFGSDLERGQAVLTKVREVVERVGPASFDPTVKWGITGDLAIGLGEYKAIQSDLTDVGLTGAVLILGVVFLYYLRVRTLIAMSLTIAVGLAWTFGFTELALGHLNIATGFLFTIVGGNGINFGIIYMARYLEERRRGEPLDRAILIAHRETWRPTLTAAAAAGAAYASLLVTEFRGFRDFGIIGGAGMILCWSATYLALPALLTLMERVAPLDGKSGGFLERIGLVTSEGIPFGKPFAFLVTRAPRVITVAGLGLALSGAALAVGYARTDPMQYDLTQVQSDPHAVAEEQRLIRIAKALTGYVGLDGMALLVERREQIAPLEKALLARRDAAPEDRKPFKAVHALEDFVPEDQPAKIDILMQLKERVVRARRRHIVSDADWNEMARFLPPDDLKPFGLDDLPRGLARPFTESDGTRGRILYISPTTDELTSDAHYLFRWADSFRRTELPDGSIVLGSGRAVIYADMWAAILDDVPRAVCVSFLATLFIVVIAFRGRRASPRVVLALLIGVAWMVGLLAIVRAKLNFLNFIALPVTFGIGVDYAVNIAERDLHDHDAAGVVRRTGGAVILCSLTTLLGYLALVRSVNFAVRSLGVAAVLGEVTCLFAAVLFLPAALIWRRSREPAPAPIQLP